MYREEVERGGKGTGPRPQPFQGVKGVAGDVGFAVGSDEGIAEVDNA